MTDSITEPTSTPDFIYLKRWEFYGFMLQGFLLIGALSALLGIARRQTTLVSNAVFMAGLMLLVPLTLLPVISASARFYSKSRIDIAWIVLWSILASVAVALIAILTHL